MASLKVTQVRSAIGTKPKQRGTLRALGLGRIGKSNTLQDRPEIRGMIAKVSHLVEVKEADGTIVRPPRKRASETRLAAGNISPVEQHTAGLAAADVTERPPAAPDTPAPEAATDAEADAAADETADASAETDAEDETS